MSRREAYREARDRGQRAAARRIYRIDWMQPVRAIGALFRVLGSRKSRDRARRTGTAILRAAAWTVTPPGPKPTKIRRRHWWHRLFWWRGRGSGAQ